MKTLSKKKMVLLISMMLLAAVQLSWYNSNAALTEENKEVQITTGKIWGIVKNVATNEPLVNCDILIKGTKLQVKTDRRGNYFLINVPCGIYKVECMKKGFKNVIYSNVRVQAAKSKRIDFILEPVKQ